PRARGQRDRAVRRGGQALAHAIAQASPRGLVERHRVRGGRPLATEERLPVVGEAGEECGDLDGEGLHAGEPGALEGGGQGRGPAEREARALVEGRGGRI